MSREQQRTKHGENGTLTAHGVRVNDKKRTVTTDRDTRGRNKRTGATKTCTRRLHGGESSLRMCLDNQWCFSYDHLHSSEL